MSNQSEIIYDYSNLLGRIKAKFGTQEAFGKAIGYSLSAINQRLNHKLDWSTKDVYNACEVLEIELKDIPDYFFVKKV